MQQKIGIWLSLVDEVEALSFGKSINSEVADTVLEELHREISEEHPLYNVGCRAIAYNARTRRNFLFETDAPAMPFVSVHFTWQKEDDARWPRFQICSDMTGFSEVQQPPCKMVRRYWKARKSER